MTKATTEDSWKVDRTYWPSGPWNDEPDKVQFRTATGLPGLIVRSDLGGLCGYVGVPREHPAYEQDYDNVSASVHVHGRLTFSGKCHGPVCHVPEPGEPDDVWWLGFDCNHSGDWAPPSYGRGCSLSGPGLTEKYRDLAYVRAQVENLAVQLVGMLATSLEPNDEGEEATDG